MDNKSDSGLQDREWITRVRMDSRERMDNKSESGFQDRERITRVTVDYKIENV